MVGTNLVLFALVVLSILSISYTSLSNFELANHNIHSRKIILDSGIYDTLSEQRLNLTYVNDHDDALQRRLYVHVNGPVERQTKSFLEKELKSKHEAQYIPHNTFIILSSKKNAREALSGDEFRRLVRWIGSISSKHKVDVDTKDCTTSDLSINVLLAPSKKINYTKSLAKKWQKSLREKLLPIDQEYANSIKVIRAATNKITVKAAKSKHCTIILKWVSKHSISDSIQDSEEFQVASKEEMIPLEDNIEVLSDVDPLSDAYKKILLTSAHHGKLIGQPSLDHVQELWKRGFDGSGEVVGVGDTGLDYNNCAFFDNSTTIPFYKKLPSTIPPSSHRKIQSYFAYADDYDLEDGHGTHVSSSLVAQHDPSNPMTSFDGIAKNAKIAFLDIGTKRKTLRIPSDLVHTYFPFMQKSGAHISSNSWGSRKYGQYTISAHEVDRFTFDNKHHLALFAAGNSGRSGSKTIVSPATAKNAFTIGSSQASLKNFKLGSPLYATVLLGQMKDQFCPDPKHCDMEFELTKCCHKDFLNDVCCVKTLLEKIKKRPEHYNQNNMATFSSRGPTKDLRIKPDLVVPGQPVFASRSSGVKNKQNCPVPLVLQGTSQSTPSMAGYALMLRQYFVRGYYPTGRPVLRDSFKPKGSTLKAVMINSGVELTGMVEANGNGMWKKLQGIPSFTQGFGLVNMSKIMLFEDSNKDDSRLWLSQDDELETGDSIQHCFEVDEDATRSFKVTLVWTDYPGSPIAAVALVNNIDLTVEHDEGERRLGNGGRDFLNNVEQVEFSAKKSRGKTFTVTVTGSNIPHGPQDYSLVVTGNMNRIKCQNKDRFVLQE